MNGQLASVVACASLYMDVGVGLNAKYAIMCRKTVLIPQNDEESTHSDFRQHFRLQYRIDCDIRSIVVLEEERSNHIFGPKSERNSDFLDVMFSLLI